MKKKCKTDNKITTYINPHFIVISILLYLLVIIGLFSVIYYTVSVVRYSSEDDVFMVIFLWLSFIVLSCITIYFSTGFVRTELNEYTAQSKLFGIRCKKLDIKTIKYIYAIYTPINRGDKRLFLLLANEEIVTKNIYEKAAPIMFFNLKHYIPIRIQSENFDRIMTILDNIGVDYFEGYSYKQFSDSVSRQGVMFYNNNGMWNLYKTLNQSLICNIDESGEN